jgi:hypothetical protein
MITRFMPFRYLSGAHDIELGKTRYKAERKVARRRSDKRKGVKATAVGRQEQNTGGNMTSPSLYTFFILTPSKATVL